MGDWLNHTIVSAKMQQRFLCRTKKSHCVKLRSLPHPCNLVLLRIKSLPHKVGQAGIHFSAILQTVKLQEAHDNGCKLSAGRISLRLQDGALAGDAVAVDNALSDAPAHCVLGIGVDAVSIREG